MKARNFENDLNDSNNLKVRKAWRKLVKKMFGEDAEIIWKDEIEIQKGMGTDVVIQTSKGRRFSIELKIRNFNCFKDSFWIMEIVSHIYDREEEPRTYLYSKEGWICLDCGGVDDGYMVKDKLWKQICMKERFLCLDCFEKRLGRPITLNDITPCLLNYFQFFHLNQDGWAIKR